MDHQKIAQCVESLCECGCDTVNATIEAMEKSQPISAAEGLTETEKNMVLNELKTIMSVYSSK